MPEFIEISYMIQALLWLIGITIYEVKSLGSAFKNKQTQTKHLNFLASLPVPFVITDIKQRGKEISIKTNKGYLMITSLGQGAYLYGLKEKQKLNEEPFKKDGFVALVGTSFVLALVDCRSFHHQVKLKWVGFDSTFTPSSPVPWSPDRGPCIYTEHAKYESHLIAMLQNEKQQKQIFKSHSIAWIMFNQSICNGFGHYTISEILFHLYLDFGIRPWDIAWDVFVKHPGLLESFIVSPIILRKESESYIKIFDPARFNKKQQRQRTKYRLDFLKVFGKKKFRGKPVVSFTFNGPKGLKTVYTVASAVPELPSGIAAKKVATTKVQKDSLLTTDKNLRETWYRSAPLVFSPGRIGVGPSDFHTPSEYNHLPGLVKSGLAVDSSPNTTPAKSKPKKTKSNPNPTKLTNETNATNGSTGKKKRPNRTGKKAEALRLSKTYLYGGMYKIPPYLNFSWKVEFPETKKRKKPEPQKNTILNYFPKLTATSKKLRLNQK